MNINELKDEKVQLLELEKEIKELKRKMHTKYRKNAFKALLIWSPAILWSGWYLGDAISRNKYPGNLDYVTKKAYTTTKYSSITGEIESEKEYAYKKDVPADVMFYYEPWVKNGDGTYSSNTEKYVLNDISEKQIKRLLDRDDLTFDDLTVLSVQSRETIKNDEKTTITSTDLEPQYEVIVYDVNSYDTIVERETKKDDMADWMTLGGLLFATSLIEGIVHASFYENGGHPYVATIAERNAIKTKKNEQKELKKVLGK